MKRFFISFLLVVTICAFLSGQNGIYFSVAPNLSGISSQSLVEEGFKSKLRPSVALGVFGIYSGFELGAVYRSRFGKIVNEHIFDETTLKVTGEFDNHYLEIPLNYSFTSTQSDKFEVAMGVFYGISLSGEFRTIVDVDNLPNGLTEEEFYSQIGQDRVATEENKVTEYGMRMAIGYRYSEKMRIRLQGSLGLSGISEDEDESVGIYSFGLKVLYNPFIRKK